MKWYAVFVETGREDIMQKYVNLLFPSELITTLVPKRKLIERKQGKTYEKVRNLLPGYVLAKTNMDFDLYYKIKYLPPVYSILKNEAQPVPIRDEEMNLILSLTSNGEVIGISEIYKEGDQIRVHRGPLKGLEGIIEKIDHRKKRAKVCIEFLGKKKRVDLGAHLIVKNRG